MPLITPFYQRGRINKKALKRLINHINKVSAVFISGFTGEFWRLKPKDKREIVKIARKTLKKPILVGVTDKDPIYDADFYVILPPKNKNLLFRYYQNCLQKFPKPIILYNNPEISSFNLPISLIKKFKNQVYGIKDSSGNLKYLKSLIKLGINVYQGDESKILEGLKLGAKGTVCGIANIFPNLPIELYKNFKTTPQKSKALQKMINQIRKTYIRDPINGIKKYADIIINWKAKIMLKLNDRNLIAPCGLYCGECLGFQDGRCRGCLSRKGLCLKYTKICKIYSCCVDKKGLRICSKCKEFPCEKFTKFFDTAAWYGEVVRNLQRIRKIGIGKFLEKQVKRVSQLITCAKEKGIKHCSECKDWPCEKPKRPPLTPA